MIWYMLRRNVVSCHIPVCKTNIRPPGQSSFLPYCPDQGYVTTPTLFTCMQDGICTNRRYGIHNHYENRTVELSRLRQLARLFELLHLTYPQKA